jgi:uncharacterized cofD-like protein
MRLRRWLSPGLGVKRWLLVTFLGLLVLALGVAHVLRQVTRDLEPGGTAQGLVDLVTLQFLPYGLRGLVAGAVGAALVGIGALRVLRNVTDPLRPTQAPLADVLYQRRQLARGPRVVAIGGGTGLSALLRGMKVHTGNLTAIVTVADDGGSSGALRAELGIPPVGDIRNCLAALADDESEMASLLGYRFPGFTREPGGLVETEPGSLPGHAAGNLLLAAATAVEGGDFEEGVRRMNRVLAVRGRVVPASGTPITLVARTRDGDIVHGQSRIMRTPGIEQVWIEPDGVAASADALAAIADAEIIVLGPGSLYTSLLPVLLIPAIRDAVAASAAVRVYACNVATQVGETQDFDLADHVEALVRHTRPGLLHAILANDRFDARIPGEWHARRVDLRWPPDVDPVPHLATADVVDHENAHRHDPGRLAAAILRVAESEAMGRRGGRRRRRRGRATPGPD